MQDIKNPTVMWIKGLLLFGIGLAASVLIIIQVGTLKGAVLLAVSVWAFCRAYYFAFYVIEKYIDPGYRFSGLISLITYLIRKKAQKSELS